MKHIEEFFLVGLWRFSVLTCSLFFSSYMPALEETILLLFGSILHLCKKKKLLKTVVVCSSYWVFFKSVLSVDHTEDG